MKLSLASVALVFSLSAPSAFAVSAVHSASALETPRQDDAEKNAPNAADLDRATAVLDRNGYSFESRVYYKLMPHAAFPGQGPVRDLRHTELVFKKRTSEDRQSLLLTYAMRETGLPPEFLDLVRVTTPVGSTILDLDSFLEELRADADHGAELSFAVDTLRNTSYQLSGMTTATLLPLTGQVLPPQSELKSHRLSLTFRHPVANDVRIVALNYTVVGADAKRDLTKVEVLVPLKK